MTNLIHIVLDEEDDMDEVGETISSQEVKSLDDSSIYSIKETSRNRVGDDTDLGSDLEGQKQGVENDSKRGEVEDDSVYQDDIDVLLEDTNTLLKSISQRVRPTGMTYFQNLKVVRKNNQEITLYESNEIIRDWLRKRHTDFLSEISEGRVVNLVGVEEKRKNLNNGQPSSRIGPDF